MKEFLSEVLSSFRSYVWFFFFTSTFPTYVSQPAMTKPLCLFLSLHCYSSSISTQALFPSSCIKTFLTYCSDLATSLPSECFHLLGFKLSSCWKCDHIFLRLTPWSRALLARLIRHSVKKFHTFCGTKPFISSFTKACHWSLSWPKLIQCTPSHPMYAPICVYILWWL